MARIIIYIVSIILAISILFIIKENCILTDIQIFTIILSIVSIIILIEQNIFSRLKTYHRNFIIYNEKYNLIDNKLRKISYIEISNEIDEQINFRNDEKDNENIVIDYINLCAEEYFWYKKGLIDKEVWKNWKNGIKEKLQIKEIKEIYDKEKMNNKNNDSYYGFFDDDSFFK